MFKTLILSSRDILGGAARAAYRLHQALLSAGINSKMLVQTKFSNDETVIGAKSLRAKRLAHITYKLDQFPLKFYPDRKLGYFSPQWVPERTASKVARHMPQIVNLHWINNGFVQIEALKKLKAPIIWTMHDMWPFTGGCHYSAGCERYTSSCGNCPLLESTTEKDLSRRVWNRKSRSWEGVNMTVVALSNWLADCARQSPLFADLPIKVIPNCIDSSIWKPVDKSFARHQLNLPQDKKIVAFHATSAHRKGLHLLTPALEILAESELGSDVELAVLGGYHRNEPMGLSIRTHALGEIQDDERLTLVYSAVDVFVLPSTEDNLPNTIMEAFACGTPCVAFSIGGVPDMIDHGTNGYLCRPFESQDLADGISWVLDDEVRRKNLSAYARQKVLKEYSPEVIVDQYLDLYQQILK